QYDEAEKLARSLYERTGAARDRFALECVLLFTSQVDLAALKAELATYMTDTDQRLSDRAYAAHLLAYVYFFSPLQLELASMVDAFYL
ncbi:hypothetical protein MXD63_45085, partial [Frankia sp. Cpl3]|nr:hypothetical protein [Frankia sp. Cpl3]